MKNQTRAFIEMFKMMIKKFINYDKNCFVKYMLRKSLYFQKFINNEENDSLGSI